MIDGAVDTFFSSSRMVWYGTVKIEIIVVCKHTQRTVKDRGSRKSRVIYFQMMIQTK